VSAYELGKTMATSGESPWPLTAPFVATANEVDDIASALRDRLHVIALPGYSAEEQVAIVLGVIEVSDLDHGGPWMTGTPK
jgi:hypothetical protein